MGKAIKQLSAPACIDRFWKEHSISYVLDKEIQAITFTFIVICDEKDIIPLPVDWFHTPVKCCLCISMQALSLYLLTSHGICTHFTFPLLCVSVPD